MQDQHNIERIAALAKEIHELPEGYISGMIIGGKAYTTNLSLENSL